MKKAMTILILGALPVFAMADGDHASDHHAGSGHADSAPAAGHHEQASHGMSGMAHDDHDAAVGKPGDPTKVSRTIEVTMDDSMRFTPNQLNFKAGETVRFVVSNTGKIRHEMVIGSMAELNEHAKMMRDKPAMKHAESNMVTLAPGEQGDVVWQFDKTGSFDFACLVPGHLEAGMKGTIEVNE